MLNAIGKDVTASSEAYSHEKHPWKQLTTPPLYPSIYSPKLPVQATSDPSTCATRFTKYSKKSSSIDASPALRNTSVKNKLISLRETDHWQDCPRQRIHQVHQNFKEMSLQMVCNQNRYVKSLWQIWMRLHYKNPLILCFLSRMARPDPRMHLNNIHVCACQWLTLWYLKPTKGDRKGDLSPLICSSWLLKALPNFSKMPSTSELMHGIKIAKIAPPISHRMFAVDSIVFTKANQEEIHHIYRLLNICKESGKKVDQEKSSYILPPSLTSSQRKALVHTLKLREMPNGSLYLEVPLTWRRKTIKWTINTMEKIVSKIKNWQTNNIKELPH